MNVELDSLTLLAVTSKLVPFLDFGGLYPLQLGCGSAKLSLSAKLLAVVSKLGQLLSCSVDVIG